MAKKRTGKAKKNKRHPLEVLAYNMGRIEKGKKDPNTKVAKSFDAGKNPKPSQKTPLC